MLVILSSAAFPDAVPRECHQSHWMFCKCLSNEARRDSFLNRFLWTGVYNYCLNQSECQCLLSLLSLVTLSGLARLAPALISRLRLRQVSSVTLYSGRHGPVLFWPRMRPHPPPGLLRWPAQMTEVPVRSRSVNFKQFNRSLLWSEFFCLVIATVLLYGPCHAAARAMYSGIFNLWQAFVVTFLFYSFFCFFVVAILKENFLHWYKPELDFFANWKPHYP